MTRPTFSAAWAASARIYDPINPAARVAEVVGGNVAANIDNQDQSIRWRNTCAVRLSYILNHSGMRLPYIPEQTVSGSDHNWYFYRVKNLIAFLEKKWGKPEVVSYPPSGGGTLAGRKGLILFEVTGWSDAAGHATLYDGAACYDHCYFNEPGAQYRTERANFWSLK